MGWMPALQFPAGEMKEHSSLGRHVQTSSGAHPASYPMHTWGSSPRDKAAGM